MTLSRTIFSTYACTAPSGQRSTEDMEREAWALQEEVGNPGQGDSSIRLVKDQTL